MHLMTLPDLSFRPMLTQNLACRQLAYRPHQLSSLRKLRACEMCSITSCLAANLGQYRDDRWLPGLRSGTWKMIVYPARVQGTGASGEPDSPARHPNMGLQGSRIVEGEGELETVCKAAQQIRVSKEGLTVAEPKKDCLYLKRRVHCGEIVEHSGTIVVKGDVDRGGAIHAEGDIIILGRLHGEAHAGKIGDMNAIIFALEMQPTKIGIAETAALGPENKCVLYPETASLLPDGRIGIWPAANQTLKWSSVWENDRESVKGATDETKGNTWVNMEVGSMRKATQMAFFTGAYISIIGLALLLFPRPLFGLFFDLQSVALVWIRVGAILAVVFGLYYLGTAWGDARGYDGADSFYMSTVIGRLFLFFSFCWLVAIGAAPPSLILIGTMNLISALLMLRALLQIQHVSHGVS